jgi:hypothetical protein
MKDEEMKKLAGKIVELEKKSQLGKSDESIQDEIEDIISHLTIEDILSIDEYIMKKNLLTK